VLHDSKAVKTFCSRMHFSLGAGCSVAAGPIGRVLEADLRAGDRGSGVCYSYSCSKGMLFLVHCHYVIRLFPNSCFAFIYVSRDSSNVASNYIAFFVPLEFGPGLFGCL